MTNRKSGPIFVWCSHSQTVCLVPTWQRCNYSVRHGPGFACMSETIKLRAYVRFHPTNAVAKNNLGPNHIITLSFCSWQDQQKVCIKQIWHCTCSPTRLLSIQPRSSGSSFEDSQTCIPQALVLAWKRGALKGVVDSQWLVIILPMSIPPSCDSALVEAGNWPISSPCHLIRKVGRLCFT